MIKELNEASKKIYDICVKAENEKWSFDHLIDHLQVNAKCYGVTFPVLMLLEIVDQFIKDRPMRDKRRETQGEDVQKGFDRVSPKWN
jgi:hypothetical protein